MKRYKFFLLASLIFLLCFCGPQKIKKIPAGERDYIFFPSLPDTPKYQYLTTFSTSNDIKKKKSKFFNFIAGEEQEKPRVIKKAYGVDCCAGKIYVCDFGSGTVAVLDLQERSFGYIGLSGSGKLSRPINLKIDKTNRVLYVADMKRAQVIAYTLAGKPLKFYGTKEQFSPSDVDIHGNKLFVCDVKGHQVHVLDVNTGETLYKIGKAGSREGELFHPTNICVADNRLYVSDTTNFRVQIFELDGTFVASFGKLGRGPGQFARNKGIAVDKENRVYVVDAAFENVQVFDRDFKLLLYFLKSGAEKHDVYLPAGIAVDYDNVDYFKEFISPKFKAEYLVFVTSNFGLNKVNVYAFGSYRE